MMEKIRKAIVEGKLFEKAYLKLKKYFLNCFNGTYRKKLFKKIDTALAKRAIRKMAEQEAIVPNKILLMTTRGGYNCNPRAIADEIIRQKLPWELVWVARMENIKRMEAYPSELKLVIRGSYEFYQEAAQSRIWIDNATSLSYLNTWKKPGQVLIQTWHGSLGIKRIESTSDKQWIKKATECGLRTDYCVSNSTFERGLFQDTFWSTAEILDYGHARNDILLTSDVERVAALKEKTRKSCGIPEDHHVALYAPTFRDGNDLSAYRLDYDALNEALTKKFGGEWSILVRFHFQLRILVRKNKIKIPEYVIDVTDYPDIQDLLLVTDVGITDYSSWICDYVLTKKPGFLFALDYQNYYTERGFYYPLESTPFPLARSNSELVQDILNFDWTDYQEKCEAFIQGKGCIDDGHAAERVVEKLKEIIGDAE